MNKFLQDKNKTNSEITDLFSKNSPFDEYCEKSQMSNQQGFNTLEFCGLVDDIVNLNKLKDYDTCPELNSLAYVDMTGWNDMFNFSSNYSVTEDAYTIPNYYNLFVQNNIE
jgi:hypothetical protein